MSIKIFIKNIIRSILITIFLIGMVSCGTYIDILTGLKDQNLESGTITYLTKELIDSGKADPNSYLVAFRTQPKDILSYLYGYRSEVSTFYRNIYHNIVPEQGLKKINFLTSFDMSDNIEGLYYISRKNRSVLENLGNIDYVKDLKADKYNVFTKIFNGKNLSKSNIVALAEVKFKDYIVAKQILDRWNEKGLIEYAEPNYYSSLYEDSGWKDIQESYNNNIFNSSIPYWLDIIKLKDAFANMVSNNRSITHPIIAVFDSGVDAEHPKLKNNMWRNPTMGIANCGDDLYGCNTTSNTIGVLGDGNVYPVGASGYNSGVSNDAEYGAHGTHVAGIIAADPSTETGGYGGVCPVCKIMAVKEVGNEGTINDMAIVRGFKYISYFQNESDPNSIVRIVNASLGKVERSRSVGIMISKMKNTPKGKGVLVVAAAGNSSTNTYTYMAAFQDVLSVSSIGQTYKKSSFSNYGKWVNIAAPGEAIVSTIPGGRSGGKDGTSMATPIVAGVAGLVVSIYPDISHEDLKKVLLVSSNSSQLYNTNPMYKMTIPGEDQQYLLLGIGIVDASLAVQKGVAQGNLYYTSQDRFTGLCGSLNIIKKDGKTENNMKKDLNGFILFMIPIVGAFFIFLRRKNVYK